MGKYKSLKWVFLIVLSSAVLLFCWWSKLIIISIILFLLIDAFTIKYFPNLLKKLLPQKALTILKYGIYMLLPLSLLIFVRTFFYDFYYVPSRSMERTLSPDDYVLVNKVSYGTKVPKYINDIPVIGSFLGEEATILENSLFRSLRGFKSFNQNDIVVFKSVKDREAYLIKRIMGMPGDTLVISNSIVKINNKPLLEMDYYCYDYIKFDTLKSSMTYSNSEFKKLDLHEKKKLKRKADSLKMKNIFLFPEIISKKENWTPDNYGPIVVPKKGGTIILNEKNKIIYKGIIEKYESREIDIFKSFPSYKYTFKNNYYFMMGDNRDNSIDSRIFGFVPESYIQGKMIFVFP